MTENQKTFLKIIIKDYYMFGLLKRANSDGQKFYKQILTLAKKH